MTDVLVIGAGASGLTAAYHLKQVGGWSVKVLEANVNVIGGRLRKDSTSWDFPVDLGGEWIHGEPSVLLNQIVDHDDLPEIPTIVHDVEVSVWDGEEFYGFGRSGTDDFKWVNSTWWDFFNDNVASFIRDDIVLGCQVTEVDYTGALSKAACENGDTYEASYVVVTSSIKVLQENKITFTPELPQNYQRALDKFQMEPGLKIFLEFQDQFYPDYFAVERDFSAYSSMETSSNYGERIFYDATFGQTTLHHILGLFVYGRAADQYLQASDESAVVDLVLQELDSMFDGKATSQYVRHSVQIWPNEPFVLTGYTRWVLNNPGPIRVLQTPIDGKLFFAGEALPPDGESWGFAHGAALSGKDAALKIIRIDAGGPPSSAFRSTVLLSAAVVGYGVLLVHHVM